LPYVTDGLEVFPPFLPRLTSISLYLLKSFVETLVKTIFPTLKEGKELLADINQNGDLTMYGDCCFEKWVRKKLYSQRGKQWDEISKMKAESFAGIRGVPDHPFLGDQGLVRWLIRVYPSKVGCDF
jgi:hypothetical protein